MFHLYNDNRSAIVYNSYMDNYLSLNRFFTKTTFDKIIDGDYLSFYCALKNKYTNGTEKSNREVIDLFYLTLSKTHRNEYIYKNSLLYELVLSKHKIDSTKVLTEFNLGKCVADFVTINGKIVAYEIKTELDVLDRIDQQIEEYYKCVPYVCILTCEKHLDRLLKKYGDSAVGIYLFNSKNKILTIKEPSANYCSIEKELIFSLLRKSEYKYIIEKNHKQIPNTTQVKYYSECMRVFCELDLDTIMKDTIHVLKKRFKTINELFYKVPKSLKMLVYQSNYTNSDYEKIFYFLNSKTTMLNKEAKDVLSIFKRQAI